MPTTPLITMKAEKRSEKPRYPPNGYPFPSHVEVKVSALKKNTKPIYSVRIRRATTPGIVSGAKTKQRPAKRKEKGERRL